MIERKVICAPDEASLTAALNHYIEGDIVTAYAIALPQGVRAGANHYIILERRTY